MCAIVHVCTSNGTSTCKLHRHTHWMHTWMQKSYADYIVIETQLLIYYIDLCKVVLSFKALEKNKQNKKHLIKQRTRRGLYQNDITYVISKVFLWVILQKKTWSNPYPLNFQSCFVILIIVLFWRLWYSAKWNKTKQTIPLRLLLKFFKIYIF